MSLPSTVKGDLLDATLDVLADPHRLQFTRLDQIVQVPSGLRPFQLKLLGPARDIQIALGGLLDRAHLHAGDFL